ncbi:heavy-metal-associated domain-containing protein [Campylobacter curvus]|uniref:heavy-metal-associated domain-containing protein n=1 Tax=Campylobacter curvus TaxID=200 RepID=UPI00146FFC08|nr:heavy metal-associated domain-containing protein [Campylobacter curvus]
MRKILLITLLCVGAFAQTINIYIEAMHCPLCTAIVRKALLGVAGVQKANVSLKTRTAVVEADENVDKDVMLEAIKVTGYPGVIK